MTSLGVALSKPVSRRQESQSVLSDPMGNAQTVQPLSHGRAAGSWLGTLLSSAPWQSRAHARSAEAAGAAAEISPERKSAKYIAILPAYCFVPLAFETLGPINHEGMAFFNNLGHRLAQITGDSRETTFLYQRLSVAIQRFNT